MFTKIDHIGVAVRNLAAAARVYVERIGVPVSSIETVESEGVRIAFLGSGETHVELLEPLNETGPVARFLEKRGEGVHHICFGVSDIDAAVADLRAAGVTLVGDAPRPGAGGCRVAFLHPKETGGVLLELSQRPSAPETGRALAPGEMVLVYLASPKERFWGLLRELDAAGAVVEGIDLGSFDDWVRAAAAGESAPTSQVFFPTHRIEKVLLDRPEGGVESLAQRFRARAGVPFASWLAARAGR